MRATAWLYFLLAITVACGGCSRISQSTSELYVPGNGLLDGRGDGYALKGASLMITPVGVDLCEHPNGRSKVEANWSVSGQDIRGINIWVDDGHGRPKEWTSGPSKGSATTGDWVGDHTTFRMTDASTGKTLALRRVYVVKCLARKPNAMVQEDAFSRSD